MSTSIDPKRVSLSMVDRSMVDLMNDFVFKHEAWHKGNCQSLRLLFSNSLMEEDYKSTIPISSIQIYLCDGNDKSLSIEKLKHQLQQFNRDSRTIFSSANRYLNTMIDKLATFVVNNRIDNSTRLGSIVEDSRDIFVVHGRNNELKETVARFLEKLDLNSMILHEQASAGRTIIEKFEAHSNTRFAVILLTADDVGCLAPANSVQGLSYRARQNVVFEWGYFVAKLGRHNVCALAAPEIEIPSDMNGILTIPTDKDGAWKLRLAQELKAVGIEVDLNKAFA